MSLEKFRLTLRKSSLARYISIILIFALVSSIFFIYSWTSVKKPVISSIDPEIGNPGDILIIRGKNFGEKDISSYVQIGGETPTSSSYVQWSPTIIMVKIPQSINGGLVYVETNKKRSNPLLFTTQSSIPVIVRETSNSGTPIITTLDTKKASIGSILIIRGKHFGALRGDSQVCFAWEGANIAQGIPTSTGEDFLQTITCQEENFEYEFWSDQEIRVRVPNGAESGNVFIQTKRGKSNNMYLEVKESYRRYTGKRTYAVSLGVDITNVTAARENALFLRIPKPITTTTQHTIELETQGIKPFLSDFQNIILHRLENISTGTDYNIKHSFIVTAFDIESNLSQQIVGEYKNTSDSMAAHYTREDALHPTNNETVSNFVKETIGKAKQNPYQKAKKLYTALIKDFNLKPLSGKEPNIIEALERQYGTPYEIAVLYTTMLRNLGIPAVTCSGFFIEKTQQAHPHWWTEVYFENLGWFSVDPTLSMGLEYSLFTEPASRQDYYFGSTDSQHIVISRGWNEQKPMTTKGSIVTRNQAYSFQPIWEEIVGNITKYSSFWSNLLITGIY